MTTQCEPFSECRSALTLQRSIISGAAALVAVAGLAPGAVHANTYTVGNASDTGSGSLRDAISSANTHAGLDTIVFAATLDGQTITLNSQISISDPIAIQGLGASSLTISGNDANRIFYVKSSGSPFDVTISSLTLTHGDSDASGGAIFSEGVNLTLQDATVRDSVAYYYGGGVAAVDGGNDVTIAITNTTITNNSSGGGGGGLYLSTTNGSVTVSGTTISDNVAASNGGGGAYLSILSSGGTVLVENSTVTGNSTGSSTVDSCGGGLYLTGGSTSVVNTAVSNNYASGSSGGVSAFQTDFSISDSEVTGNQAGRVGGGLYSDKASFTMSKTTVSNNTANDAGGGLYIQNFFYAGTGTGGVSIEDSTISGNIAASAGGIALQSAESSGRFDVLFTNDTIAGNTATGDAGGLHVFNLSNSLLTVESSTIVGNSAGGTGGGVLFPGGNRDVVLHDSVVANNNDGGTAPDLGGAFAANYNFITSSTGATLTGANNNTSGADPMLGSLADNGGPTYTMLPLTGSPLIDAGDPAFVSPPTSDQRGEARVYNGTIDIGAVEVGAAVVPPLVASVPVPGLGSGGRGLLAGLLAGLALLGVRRRRGRGTA